MHTKTSHAFYKKVVFNASGNSIVSKMLFIVYCAVGVLFGRREWLKCTKEQALPDL